MNKHKISRRRFLKAGLTIAGTSAGLGHLPEAFSETKTGGVSRTALKPLRAIPTTCDQCPAGCGVIAYLDGDRLVQILGNPDHPVNMGGICAKGLAAINLVNDPERVLYPLKRAGLRGEGKWTRITWDEAYNILSRRLARFDAGGQRRKDGRLVFDLGREHALWDGIIEAFDGAVIIRRQMFKNINERTACLGMTGYPALIEDVGRAGFILNFGANPFANHDHFIGMARRLVSAQVEGGARLVTFDVRMSETAARSREWHPLKAGTDGSIALAMAKTILESGLADEDFLAKNTNCSLDQLMSHLAPYTADAASSVSGLDAGDIVRLAREFASTPASAAILGGGVTDHANGTETVRCIRLLNWMVGNLERPGGLFFPRYPSAAVRKNTKESQKSALPFSNSAGAGEVTDGRIDTYFSVFSNPAFSNPDCLSSAKSLSDPQKVGFLAVFDTHITETARLADLVLPASTFLESWNLSDAPSLDGNPVLNLTQPVVSLVSPARALRSPVFDSGKLLEPTFEPRGEAEEVVSFWLELAKRTGGTLLRSLPYKSTSDYLASLIGELFGDESREVFAALKSRGFFSLQSESSFPQAQPEPGVATPSGKIEIYSEEKKSRGLPAYPTYQPLHDAQPTRNSLILTTFKSSLFSTGTANSKWTREILHDNPVWINKNTAEKMGLKQGDKVLLESSAGALEVRVLTTERIHPESAALAEGFGHSALGRVARSQKFHSSDPDTGLLWWHQKGSGVNPFELIENRKDPLGGGQGSKDTIVTITKI